MNIQIDTRRKQAARSRDNVLIAIQDQSVPGLQKTSTYSKRWIEYCQKSDIPHKIVNCYHTDIIARLRNCDALMWNFSHNNPKDLLMARHVLWAAEQMGLVVFPDFATCWHFDDKLAQKYLLDAIGLAAVPTWAFYTEADAREWLQQAKFPLVAKLRRGAGSYNVRLVSDFRQAEKYCDAAFGHGLSPVPGYFADFSTKLRRIKSPLDLRAKFGRFLPTLFRARANRREIPQEIGYVLFQDFVPGNTHDTRITVIGNRAFGFIRHVRKGEWRASGSGSINYDRGKINLECIRLAFAVTSRLKSQSMAFDFVESDGNPLIVEISYGYVPEAVYSIEGYWDNCLEWHPGHVWPEHAMIEDVLDRLMVR